jgi:hypothetical protein
MEEAIGAVCPKEYVFSDRITKGEQAGCGTPAHLVLKVLLWLAGPYEHYHGWIVRTPVAKVVGRTKEFIRRMMRTGPASLGTVLTSVPAIGIRREWGLMWISVVEEIRTSGDKVAVYNGNLSDKAFTILGLSGRPMSIDDLCREIGGECSKRTLANYISVQKWRFRRTGPGMFSLTDWGGPE